MSTGLGPTSSAVGIFEPVTMMRSTSVVGGGVGAAPMSVDIGWRFWANAFDAIMRGIPTQAAKVMRRNPNLECPVLVMVSPSFEVRVFSKLSHHCYNSEPSD